MADQQGVFSQYNEEQMSQEQQDRLEDYVVRGYHIIYDEGQAVANFVSKDPINKVDNVASAGLMIAKKIDMSAQDNKEKAFPDEIKAVGGYHLIEKIIQLAEHRGAGAFEPSEKQAALQGAYQKYIEDGIRNKTIDPVELAKSTEKAEPGSVSQMMASIPDTGGAVAPTEGQAPMGPPPEQGIPPQGPPQQGPPMAAPQQPQGLLTKPTALQQLQGGM